MITIKIVPAEAQRFQTYLPTLPDSLPSGSAGLVAEVDGFFAGTALVIVHPSSGMGSISVLHTEELFRNLGVGSRLLEEAERYLLETGCAISRLTLTLRQGKPAPELEFLHSRGYEREILLYRSYTLRSASMREDPRFARFRLPDGFELKPLMSASASERAELEHIAAGLSPDVAPFQEERLLHPELSMFMKIGGEIAGWMGIQQLASNLLLLRSIYVRPAFRLRAGGIAMFIEMHRKSGFLDRFAYQMLNINGDNRDMLRLADRKFAPHAANVKSIVRLEKRL